MLRVESNTKLVDGFTEFEEDILFDADDPDFDHSVPKSVPIIFKMPSNMSLAGVHHHPAEMHSSHSSLTTLSHSLEDITSNSWSPPPSASSNHYHSDHVLTIEELRLQMTSCFTCGVSWNDSHVSLDCSECGGYALERPCPECDGVCGMIWKRDLSMSHASSRARWQGECGRRNKQITIKKETTINTSNNNAISNELSSRLEKLSANS